MTLSTIKFIPLTEFHEFNVNQLNDKQLTLVFTEKAILSRPDRVNIYGSYKMTGRKERVPFILKLPVHCGRVLHSMCKATCQSRNRYNWEVTKDRILRYCIDRIETCFR